METRRSSSGSDRMKTLIDEMENILRNGKKGLLGGGYVLDKDRLENLVADIKRNMPAEIEQARKIMRDRNLLIANAEKEYNERIQQAQDEAAQIKADADAYVQRTQQEAQARAQSYYDQKIEEGNKMLIAYQNQAARVLAEANDTAAQLVDENEVMIRAKVEADEVRMHAYEETDELKRQTYQYLDEALMDIDDVLEQKQLDMRRLKQSLTLRSQQDYQDYNEY